MRLTIRMLVITMSHIQDIIITHTPTIMGIMVIVITRVLALITVTEIMAAIEAGILLMGGIMDMAAIEEGTETTGTVDMAVIAAAIMAASIDKNANIFT